ncbi:MULTISPECIES: hypothetical protein [Marinomonas]|uniref:Uncharacterized protein n=1 Tax=Marinomonas alcarazii TaxID=491949 RepID=A0A318VMN0_9GAMM|nr:MULTISPECIES: hypothetical protein [Marinomonas]PYF84879.1 hypothetical protein DFP75_101921 [Marinomonas alcarazii]
MNKNKLIIAALLAGSLSACSSMSSDTSASKYDVDGFTTKVEDGRLWVFEEGSKELEFFKEHGEPAKQYTNIGAGPDGMTVKSASQETLDKYLSATKK